MFIYSYLNVTGVVERIILIRLKLLLFYCEWYCNADCFGKIVTSAILMHFYRFIVLLLFYHEWYCSIKRLQFINKSAKMKMRLS